MDVMMLVAENGMRRRGDWIVGMECAHGGRRTSTNLN